MLNADKYAVMLLQTPLKAFPELTIIYLYGYI
jgi:hypothetical protein